MLELITGEAGTGKSYEMMKRISEAVSSGKKVFAIVPDQFNFEYNRTLYSFMGMENFNRMEVLGFSRLAKYIFIKHGGLKGKYADDTVRSIIMFRALSELNAKKSLHFYAKQAERTRFAADALEFVKALSLNGVTPQLLAERSAFLEGGSREKAEDIALICSEYFRLLEENGFKDNRTDISEAAKKAAENNYFADSVFFIDEFKSFTPDEYEMLQVIIRDSELLTVCLTTGDSVPRKFSLFETVNKTAAKLSDIAREYGTGVHRTVLAENRRFDYPELEFLSRNVLRPERDNFDGECGAVRIFEAAEPYEEADFIGAEINHLVREKGYRYSDIVITSRVKENYSSILGAALERCGIPCHSEENESVAHKSLVIFVCTALRLVSSGTPSTEELLRYVKTGFSGLDEEQTDILEEYCYKWNVEGKMWQEPFEIHDEQADGQAESARTAVISPLLSLKKKCGGTAAEICRGVYEFLEETGVPDRIIAFAEAAENGAEMLAAARESKQLWDMLCGLLECFYKTLGDTKITAAEFSSLFETAAASLKLSSPPQTLDQVQFCASDTARFANPKVVFIAGANEGTFPFAAKPSPLLTDKDIEALKKCGIEISGGSAEKLAEERFTAYAALSAPSERLYISYPTANVSGGSLYPSFAVKQVTAMFGEDITLNSRKLGLLYFCTTEKSGYYRYVQSFKRESAEIASLRCALEEFDPENKRRFDYLDKPAGVMHKLTDKNTAERLFGRNITLSASRFEDYRLCPFMYFCKKGLRIYPRQRKELDAPSRGTAVHYCLSEFLRSYGKEQFVSMSTEEISEAVKDKLAEYFTNDEIGGSYGKTKRYLAAYGRLADTVTDIIVHLKAEFAQSLFTPSSFEYTLSFDGDEKPVKLTAADGTEIYFIGAVDRVDVYEENGITYIRIVDYKTGTKAFSLADIYYGVNMQMLLYMFALTDPYAPVNEGLYHAALPAGVLYMHAGDNVPSLPRNAAEDDIDGIINGGVKVDGVVLNDVSVVKAMEKEGAGVFIPVRIKKDGEFYAASKVVSESQLDALRKYSAELIKDTAVSVKSGKIEAAPLILNSGKSPCTYCDYSSICGNFPNIVSRAADPEAAEKMLEILNASLNE
ncbi:MAG: PD-(D/E)XK nuclease family protein [Oscillospiraceae bacterium]|nr:PD-(D/E)XK nuclease family protein [Oscillospiraceae bacterium]